MQQPKKTSRIEAPFAGTILQFNLTIPRLEELQEVTGCGPERIYRDLVSGQWRAEHVRSTLRLGLIGAGMAARKAAMTVERYCDDGQLAENVEVAAAIMLACLVGVPVQGNDDDADASDAQAV